MASASKQNKSLLKRIVNGEVQQETLDAWISKLAEAIEKRDKTKERILRLKEAVWKARKDGMTLREIAATMGMSHGTIANWLKEAPGTA